jgi:DNA-nicking Smr family endonuclease
MARRKKRSSPDTDGSDTAAPAPGPAPRVATSFGALLADAEKRRRERPAPATEAPPPPVLPAPGPGPRVPVPSHPPPVPKRDRVPPGPAAVPVPPRPPTGSVLSAAEQAVLQRAFAGTRPIARPARGRKPASPGALQPGRPPDPVLERAARDRLAALVAGGVRFKLQRDGDEVTGLGSGADERVLVRLGGSGFTPEATLDLHGLRVAEVGPALERFVRNAQRAGRRYVLLIHGKGHHSSDGVGVLGDAVIEALVGGGAAPVVVAFATPHAKHGGSGALAVALR